MCMCVGEKGAEQKNKQEDYIIFGKGFTYTNILNDFGITWERILARSKNRIFCQYWT